MLTALIVIVTATVLVLAAAVVAVLTGWFPRLAALAARFLVGMLPATAPRSLDPRERAELAARLWVPLAY